MFIISSKKKVVKMVDNLSYEYQLENTMIDERKIITKNLEFC
jgi:hypothetical protein